MASTKILVTGANGQLGRALEAVFPDAEYTDLDTFDISDPTAYTGRDWRQYGAIINAAAYTAVDTAETPEGRITAWRANVSALTCLAKTAAENHLTLVHISSDYVFDGSVHPHKEDEPFSPLSVYGQTKAAGDAVVATIPRHYLIRTSWVVGDGKNFVRTVIGLHDNGIKPSVVGDQFGRLTFTEDLAKGIRHLLDAHVPYGTYNLSNDGTIGSWADVAKAVYEACGGKASDVSEVSTAEYFAGKSPVALRPPHSELDLTKIKQAGFKPRQWRAALAAYITQERVRP